MADDDPPELELDDDVPSIEDKSNAPDPAAGGTPLPTTAPVGSGRPSFGTLLLGVSGLAVAVLLCAGLGGYLFYERVWNTPERALKALAAAASDGDLVEARRYVAPSAWPISEAAVPEGLARAVSHYYGAEEVVWTEESEASAASTWTEPTAIPELTASLGVWMEKHDGRWKLARYDGGWDATVSQAAELVGEMRAAAEARDAERFLERVTPSEKTCQGKECKSVAEAIASGTGTPMLDTVRMENVEPGTLHVSTEGDDLVVHWLRWTRFLGQRGMFELRFRKVDGRWMVVSADNSNFRGMDDAMETWTENHGEMLWRVQLSTYVEVGSRDSYCAEWFYGICLTKILPTHVQNVGTQTIREIKVSKVRSLKYMGTASQTLWGTYRNIAPGRGTSTPSSYSPPVRTRVGTDLSETWEFYRVNWVVFEDGTRLDYNAQDYRNTEGGTLSFEDVRAARVKGGLSTKEYDSLERTLEASGYPPPAAASEAAAPIP